MFETQRVLIGAYSEGISGPGPGPEVYVTIAAAPPIVVDVASTVGGALQVVRAGSAAVACSVEWALGGTMLPSDYVAGQPLAGLLSFGVGVRSLTVNFAILAHPYGTPDKVLRLSLSNAIGCTISGPPAVDVPVLMPAFATFTANPDTATVALGNILIISPLVNDVYPPGTIITALTSPPQGSATIINSGTQIRYQPPAALPAAPVAFAYTLTAPAPDNRTRTASISVTVTASTGGGTAFDWTLNFPAAGSVTAGMCKVWRGGGTPPASSPGNIMIRVGGGAPISNLNTGGYEFKGPLVVMCETFQPVPSGLTASYSTQVKGRGEIASIKFASNAQSHVTWEGRDWPFYWFVNNYIDYAANDCSFGDIMKITQNGAQENVAFAFAGPKAAVFWQKIYILNGPHYVSLDQGGGFSGHSDGTQHMGGVPLLRVADCHLKMCGGQTFFQGREAEVCGFPRTTRWELWNTALVHQGKWNPAVQIGTGNSINRIPDFVMGYEGDATGFEVFDYSSGKYLATRFTTQCYVQGLFPNATTAEKLAYLNSPVGVGINANGDYTFATAVNGTHTYPLWAGSLRYLPPSATLPQTCNPAHAGHTLSFGGSDAEIIARFIQIIQA